MYSRIAYVVYIGLCISGLSWQVYELSSSYFKFDVSTSIQLQYSGRLPDDALNVCFDYYQIFLFDQYNRDTNQNVAYNDFDALSEWESNHELFDNLTVDEILKYSPRIDDTLQDCVLRNVTPDEAISKAFGDECLQFLQVSKFVSGYSVCYRFILEKRPAEGFDDAMIAFDTSKPYVVTVITFNKSLFDNVTQFAAFYNSKDSLPTEELIRTFYLDRIRQPNNQVMFNSFGISYKEDSIQNLGPPYTTKCRDGSHRNHYLACVNESVVSTFNRLSPMSQHTNGSLKLVSDPLLRNTTSFQQYFDIVQDCRNMSQWDDCHFTIFTSSNDEKISWDEFQVFSIVSDQFNIFIETRARLLFLDFMTLCFSCFGTWLGFSFLGVNPFKWKKLQSVYPVEAVSRSSLRPLYQTIRILLETVKQQEEFNIELDQELQTVRNEVKKLTIKLPH